jgi:hypothetical protein
MTRLLSLLLLLAATACRLNPDGRCSERADCPAGLDCLNHVCANCRSDLECWSYTFCSSAGLCELRPGSCRVDADCPTYDRCTASHTCVLRSDHCANDAACTGAYLVCDPEHHCSLEDGRCLVSEDCNAWLASCDTAASRCLLSTTAGDDVLAVGTLVEGACDRGAISRATTAAASAAVEIGLGCGSAPDGVARMDPLTGGVVYRHQEAAGGDTLRRFRQDALGWDAAASLWRFPADASANDDFALAPGACPITWDRWAMQAATGKLLYACPIGGVPPQRDFYDEADVRVLQGVREVLSWNYGGYLLVVSGSGAVQVIAPSGVATSVIGLPVGTGLAHRATGTGFRVALASDVTGKGELWEVDELTGGAAQAGTYADVLPGYTGGAGSVLDEAGALYGVGFRQLRAVVLKRPLAPGTTSVVYSEESLPAGANDFAAATFKPFLRLDGFLATRP